MYEKLVIGFTLFVLASFVLLSLFGFGVGMEMDENTVSSCPFMASQMALCQMSIFEHIGTWQQAFWGVPSTGKVLIFTLLFAVSLVIVSVGLFFQKNNFAPFVRPLLYLKSRADHIFDPFVLVFSDGILNPKIYRPTHR